MLFRSAGRRTSCSNSGVARKGPVGPAWVLWDDPAGVLATDSAPAGGRWLRAAGCSLLAAGRCLVRRAQQHCPALATSHHTPVTRLHVIRSAASLRGSRSLHSHRSWVLTLPILSLSSSLSCTLRFPQLALLCPRSRSPTPPAAFSSLRLFVSPFNFVRPLARVSLHISHRPGSSFPTTRCQGWPPV